ncbi:MAG: SDR family oxidoreductase [Pseudomonadota bacterium]
MADLKDKVAVITGASSGIGLSTVETFVEAGANVVAADINETTGKSLEERFGTDRVRFSRCDVTSPKDLEAAMQVAADAFGGLDILFNNAGHGGTVTGVEDLDLDGYDHTMDLLLKAVFVGSKYAIPHMKKRGGGAILNTASVASVSAGYGPIVYSVAKKGVAYFSKVAAAELSKHNIRVNAILPGFIATSIFGASLGMPEDAALQMSEMLAQKGGRMQPAGRVGKGSDIAEMAAFLASDAAGFITGGEFLVDGGITVGPPHSWNEDAISPILDAMGISQEQAEQMRAAMQGGQSSGG